jgi:hypothetical protein
MFMVMQLFGGQFNFFFLLCVAGMDFSDPKRKNNVVGKILLAASLTAVCIIMLKHSPTFNSPSPVTPCSFVHSLSVNF